MSRLSRRVLAFLSGINDERPDRERIARAVHRSLRSVERAMSELVENLCISVSHSGHGKPGKITIIRSMHQVLAVESKMAVEREKVAVESPKMAVERPRIKDLGKVLEKEQQQAAVSEYFGSTKIGGVAASHRVISEVAGILRTPEAVQDFKLLVRHRFKDIAPHSWGLLVLLARDVAVTRKPPGHESADRAKEAHA